MKLVSDTKRTRAAPTLPTLCLGKAIKPSDHLNGWNAFVISFSFFLSSILPFYLRYTRFKYTTFYIEAQRTNKQASQKRRRPLIRFDNHSQFSTLLNIIFIFCNKHRPISICLATLNWTISWIHLVYIENGCGTNELKKEKSKMSVDTDLPTSIGIEQTNCAPLTPNIHTHSSEAMKKKRSSGNNIATFIGRCICLLLLFTLVSCIVFTT